MNGLKELAEQAGLYFYEFVWTSPTDECMYPEGVYQEALERFAKLVEDKTRQEMREEIIYTWVPPHFVDMAIESCAERAWLALVKHKQPWNVRQDVTDAIRARS